MKICAVCGKEYNSRNKYTCSMACYVKYKTNIKTCIICGKEFNASVCSDTVTCSPECSRIHRQNMHKQGVYAGTLDKAHEALPLRPLTGRFETHMHAKTWKIQAPDGEIYKCRNLKLWLREHENMLDGTVAQAWDGITKIKYSMQGKRKNKSYQWKGWRLIDWGEE